MTEWWQSLQPTLQFFYAVSIISTLVLLFQTILILFTGMDDIHTGDIDPDVAAHSGGLHILSVRTVCAFFVGFGWTGVLCLKANLGVALSLLVAAVDGSVFMFAVYFLMKTLYGLRDSGTLDYRNAIGQIGSVYLPIPASMAGPGQIEVQIQGRLSVVHAFTRSDRRLENRSKVKVVDLVDPQTLLVEPLVADKKN